MSEEEPPASDSAVSLLLRGDDPVSAQQRLNALVPLVYGELEVLAHRQLACAWLLREMRADG